ncbi:MAG TPA: hypothetical protein VKQ30_04560 [Ktedonobacterales bacterium]|nr:hypothetical protein [Ktedonobacterales bacterium]
MTQHAQQDQAQPCSLFRGTPRVEPPCGSVRACVPYGGELARHRLITADGHDYVVATTYLPERKQPYTTGAYPVSRGYLVMVRQPLYEVKSLDARAAREQHEQLVSVLVEVGVGVVRARRALAARQRAENAELQRGYRGLHLLPSLTDTQRLEVDPVAAQSAPSSPHIAVVG